MKSRMGGGKEEKQKWGRTTEKGEKREKKKETKKENKIKNWLVYIFFKNITFLKTRMYHLLMPQGLQIFYQFLFQLGNSCSATYSENKQ